jgi:hypothetical protein
MKRAHLIAASLSLLFVGIGQARADLLFYNNPAAFAAATTGTTTIGFEGIAPANGFRSYEQRQSLTLHGVTFSALDSNLSVVSGSYYKTAYGNAYNLGTGDFLMAGNGTPSMLHLSMASAFQEVAFNLGTFDRSNSRITIRLSTGDTFLVSAPYPTSTFVGFTSTTPIHYLDLMISSGERRDTLSLDRFTFGPVHSTPEPASLTLFLLGGVGFAWLGRRKITRPARASISLASPTR